MQKKEYRLIGVAIIVGGLALAAHFYFNSEESPTIADEAVNTPKTEVSNPQEIAPETQPPTTDTPAQVTQDVVTETPPEAPYVDPFIVQQEALLKGFKDKIRLNIALPSDMKFDELDLDADVAAMQGSTADRKLAILAAPKTASPQIVEAFLQENKSRIPLLGDYDFKITGKTQNVAAPKNSGISKITVIPGGEKNGSLIYAALLERTDKKGSYLLVMEGSPAYFEKYEGDLDAMMSSLSVK